MKKLGLADRDKPDTPNPDNPPLVEDQKGAGEAGTSKGSPESKKMKNISHQKISPIIPLTGK